MLVVGLQEKYWYLSHGFIVRSWFGKPCYFHAQRNRCVSWFGVSVGLYAGVVLSKASLVRRLNSAFAVCSQRFFVYLGAPFSFDNRAFEAARVRAGQVSARFIHAREHASVGL